MTAPSPAPPSPSYAERVLIENCYHDLMEAAKKYAAEQTVELLATIARQAEEMARQASQIASLRADVARLEGERDGARMTNTGARNVMETWWHLYFQRDPPPGLHDMAYVLLHEIEEVHLAAARQRIGEMSEALRESACEPCASLYEDPESCECFSCVANRTLEDLAPGDTQ